jgi:hypothetical protein
MRRPSDQAQIPVHLQRTKLGGSKEAKIPARLIGKLVLKDFADGRKALAEITAFTPLLCLLGENLIEMSHGHFSPKFM